jgi:hypothetical protein
MSKLAPIGLLVTPVAKLSFMGTGRFGTNSGLSY